jgi:hypothetical protein
MLRKHEVEMAYTGPTGRATKERDANHYNDNAHRDDIDDTDSNDDDKYYDDQYYDGDAQHDARVVQVLMTKIPRTSDRSVILQLLKVIEKKGKLTGFEHNLVYRFGKRWFCINPAIAELMLTQSKQESDLKAVQQMSSIGVSDALSYQEIMNSVLIHFPEDGSHALIYDNFSKKDEDETTRIVSDLSYLEKKPRERHFELYKRHTLIFETPEEAKRLWSKLGNWNRVLLKDVVFVETKAQFQAYDTPHVSLFKDFGFQYGARDICYKYTRGENVQVGRLPPINVRRTFCTAEAMIDSFYYIRSTSTVIQVPTLEIAVIDLEDHTPTIEEMINHPTSLFGTKGIIKCAVASHVLS